MKKGIALLLVLCTLLSSCRVIPVDSVDTSDLGEQSTPTDVTPPSGETGGADTDGTVNPGPSAAGEAADLVISEVMPDNDDLIMGHTYDWVEIYNKESTAVKLDSYFLTDDLQRPYRFPLTGYEIPAQGYAVITLDDSAAFHLSAALGETVYLTRNGKEISKLQFEAMLSGQTVSPEGINERPTPGYANTEDGYLSYLDSLTLPDLIISEVISSNQSHLPKDGECYDLIEIYNRSNAPISLKSYTVSDKRSEPARFAFPDVTLEAGGYYLIYCSGDPTLGNNHASFKISASGETVVLAKDGVITDLLRVPGDLPEDESYGRDGNRPVYMTSPTPGSKNNAGYLNGIASPTASHASGVYKDAISLTLSGKGKIYYTLDGSRPSTSSRVYDEPIPISKVTTVRAYCVDGTRSSGYTAFTYLIGTEHELPVVTIAIPQKSLTGSEGVLNHVEQTYEHEAVLTLIEDGEEKFSIPFGFRLHGNDSRKEKKQNFQLRFRSDYGVGKLKYKLFDDREFDEYNSLLLKGGSEDWSGAIMRDELCTAIVDGTTALYAQAIKPCVLYLGGEYWGIYYLRERFSDDYVASHFGVSEESVNLLYYTGGVQSGSSKDYRALIQYVKTHDMSRPENYAYLCEKVDITSLMDWYICRSYMGDKDLANIRFFNSSEGDGKWRWMYFDLDWAFWHTTDQPVTSIIKSAEMHTLINGALASKEGQDAFLSRYAELMDTILNEEYVIGVIDKLAASIESEVERDRARWGSSVSSWEKAVEKLRAYVRDGVRDRNVLKDLKNFFVLSDNEMAAYFD